MTTKRALSSSAATSTVGRIRYADTTQEDERGYQAAGCTSRKLLRKEVRREVRNRDGEWRGK